MNPSGNGGFSNSLQSPLPARVDDLGHLLHLPVIVSFEELFEPNRLKQYLKDKTAETLRLVDAGLGKPAPLDADEPVELTTNALAHYSGEQRQIDIRVADFSSHRNFGVNITFELTESASRWLANRYQGFNPDAHEAYIMAWHSTPMVPEIHTRYYMAHPHIAIVLAQDCEQLGVSPLIVGQTLLYQKRFMR